MENDANDSTADNIDNFTEEEFHYVLRDLIYQLEDEDHSLREVRRQFYLDLLLLVGIVVVKEMVNDELRYVAYFEKNCIKQRVDALKSWLKIY